MNVYIETYGCTANKSDQSTIEGILLNQNHTLVSSIDQADAVIILTCTVIDTTEQRMLSRIKTLNQKNKKLIIAGCMPVVQSQQINKIAPKASLITPMNLHKIPSLLSEKKNIQKNISKITLPRHYSSIIAPIAIAEGCQQSCNYCITHFARGKLISYPSNEIKNTVQHAIETGCKEIQLTAQDTASYGNELKTDNLGNLLHQLSKIPGNYRIRVGMMNPLTTKNHLTDIINGFQSTHIYKFLHLPIQSGDNQLLHNMNRGYTIDTIKTIITEFRKKFPTLTVSTDVIAGYPQETAKQHQNTIKLLKEIKPDIVNITRFSARPFTKAKTQPGRIPTNIVKQRSRELTILCESLALENNTKHINKSYSILITKKTPNNKMLARTSTYKPVIINELKPIGSFWKVKIKDVDPIHLYGNLINI